MIKVSKTRGKPLDASSTGLVVVGSFRGSIYPAVNFFQNDDDRLQTFSYKIKF